MRRQKRRGLSLVEVIISLSLLAAILIFVLNLFPTALATLHQVERNARLDQHARNLLELYSAEPASQWPVGRNEQLAPVELEQRVVSPSIEVLAYQDSKPEVLVLLRVRLDWKEHEQPRSLIRESLINRSDR